MTTERNVVDFKIHNLTEEQFQELKEAGQIDPNALYCTPDETVANFEEVNARIDTKQDIATAVNYGHVTNCITEIPQDIKLELNNGVLTLKAGSKVYVPNGINTYDELIIPSDIVYPRTGVDTLVLVIRKDTLEIKPTSLQFVSSGNSNPQAGTTYNLWYDTANNVIKKYETDTSTPAYTASLPFAIIKVGADKIESIDQVFNGFGYIGSTVFALSGVKVLIPNGRNADGGLNNIEVTTSTVQTMTMTPYMVGRTNAPLTLWEDKRLGGMEIDQRYWGIVKKLSDIIRPSYYACYYCLEDNLVHYFNGSGVESIKQCAFIGFFNVDSNNRITQFAPKPAFHAVDYNDLIDTSKNAIAIAAPAGIVAAFAGSTPPAGWLKCDGSAISRERYADLFAAIGGNYGWGDGSTTFNLPTQSVLPLGTSAPVSLTANGTLQIKNSVGGFENVVKSASGDSAARRELVVNADSNGQNGVVQYGSGITGTANLANATGAKAIVCIKY